MLFNKQRYEFFSKSQRRPHPLSWPCRCCSISKDTNFSANHNILPSGQNSTKVLFNKQRYEFFSKSQHFSQAPINHKWCCSISKDTNFSANHNDDGKEVFSNVVLFNKQRYEFFSKSQQPMTGVALQGRCCSISKDTNFSANHNRVTTYPQTSMVLFNKQRYEFFSKSQHAAYSMLWWARCCSISKDTNFSANHNYLA